MLFFTEKGKCYWLKVYQIPEGTRISKGRAIQNLINIEPDDKIHAFINVRSLADPEYLQNKYIVFCTKKGIIKKTPLEAFSRPRQNGIMAISIREEDNLLEAKLTNGTNEILLAVRSGKAIRFHEKNVRSMGRTASGVKGITLAGRDDEVVGMVCIDDKCPTILVVSEKGYGKRSELEDYRITQRGGKGVKTMNITPKTGKLVAVRGVNNDDDLMIITRNGIIIRLSLSCLRVMGRATQGVKLIKMRGEDTIAAVTRVDAAVVEEEKHLNEMQDNIDENTASENNPNGNGID